MAVRRQAGHNARVTVETGAENRRPQREHENYTLRLNIDDGPGNLEQIRRRRQERVARPVVYYEQVSDQPSRRNSVPTRTRYSSPGFGPSRPPSEPSPDAEIVVEAPAITEDSYGFVEDLDFKIPKAAEGVHFSDDVGFIIPDPGSHGSQEKPSALSKPKFTGEMTELVIAHSTWDGNTFDRGELGARLGVTSIESEASDKQRPPLTRWYHLQRPMMSFEEFIAASQSVLQLPEKEQRAVVKLRRDVQKKFEKQRHNGRELEANCVSDVFYNDSTGTSKQMESVLFLCFPYFCLEPYSPNPIKALTPGSPLHPARPLLQAHFYSSSGKRELSQAITTLPSTPNGECLHVSQLWCLVVNGNTMVTCQRQSLDALCGSTITRTVSASSGNQLKIKVSMGSDRSWNIPVTPETSWPTFLAFFGEKVAGMEAQRASAQFTYNKKTIDGKVWRELLEAAKTSTVDLTMQDVRFHITDADEQMIQQQIALDDDDETMVGVEDELASNKSSGAEPARTPELSQINQPRASMPLEPSTNLQLFQQVGSNTELRILADGLHKILLSNERTAENVAYTQCPKAKLADITAWLSSDSRRKGRDLRSEGSRLLRKPKRRILIVAKYLFHMFFPMDFEHAMTDRYWGALSKILNREDEFYAEGHNNPKSDISAAVDMYNLLHDEILPLASMLAEEFTGYEQDLMPLPDAFSKAWLHLVTAIVLISEKPTSLTSSFRESAVSKHLRAITEELEKGKVDIMTRLHLIDLDDLEICAESSILALLVDKIAQDVMHGAPDVVTSYATYFQRLEFSVTDDPAPRYHQQKTLHFLQEVEAILATLEHQLSVVETFQTSLEQQTAGNDAVLIYSLGQSRQSVVIEDCKARIGGKLDKFKGLQKRAEDLGEWHRNEMDTHKDRQESAILVFTIVTIIFLPLSFVSSVFGMNTEDIRDMTFNQWAYWAAAVPLTVLVVFGSLWFAGELGGIGRWISALAHRSPPTSNGQQASLGGTTTRSHTARMGRANNCNEPEQLSSRSRRRTTYPRGEV